MVTSPEIVGLQNLRQPPHHRADLVHTASDAARGVRKSMDIKTSFEMIRAQPDGPVKKFELLKVFLTALKESGVADPGTLSCKDSRQEPKSPSLLVTPHRTGLMLFG